MKTLEIEKLIEKYINAETSLEEEVVLNNYFNTESELPSHLEMYKSLFQYFTVNKAESYTQDLPFKPSQTKRLWFSAIAAGFALLIGGFAFQNYQNQRKAEKALADTKMAMELIAKHFNKGNKAIHELNKVELITSKAFGQKLSISQ